MAVFSADAAMLVRARMLPAFLRAQPAGDGAGLKSRDQRLLIAAGAAGAERTCRQADVGAVEVQTNALAKLRDHLFRQTGISARRADLST